MALILVVDDDAAVRRWIVSCSVSWGHEVIEAAAGQKAIALAIERRPDLAILDLRLGPGPDGLQVFTSIRRSHPTMNGIIVTGYETVPSAFASGRSGILEYLEKPLDTNRLREAVETAAGSRTLPAANISAFARLLGVSEPINEVREQILEFGPLDETVLLIGETGTGKELTARSLHEQSSRGRGPFIAVNCGAVQPTLFEAAFFGHERGAFTGADERRLGYFEAAHGGTLFLDEVGELPLDMQSKLLRVIEGRAVQRVGSTRLVPVDVRLVAATNVELGDRLQAGRFRPDLFHRLDQMQIRLPPLRERRDDIAPIAEHALASLGEQYTRPIPSLSGEAIVRLCAHDWPGNVRELENVVRKAFFAARGPTIGAAEIAAALAASAARPGGLPFTMPVGVPLKQALWQFERELIRQALGHHRTLTATAQSLGIDERTLYEKRLRYGLDADGPVRTT